jgi:hypothetical protein
MPFDFGIGFLRDVLHAQVLDSFQRRDGVAGVRSDFTQGFHDVADHLRAGGGKIERGTSSACASAGTANLANKPFRPSVGSADILAEGSGSCNAALSSVPGGERTRVGEAVGAERRGAGKWLVDLGRIELPTPWLQTAGPN